jgi:pentatricopeptide repeat protein
MFLAKQALALRPRDHGVLSFAAAAYCRNGLLDEAAEVFDQIDELKQPDEAVSLYFRAIFEHRRGRPDRAAEYLTRARRAQDVRRSFQPSHVTDALHAEAAALLNQAQPGQPPSK